MLGRAFIKDLKGCLKPVGLADGTLKLLDWLTSGRAPDFKSVVCRGLVIVWLLLFLMALWRCVVMRQQIMVSKADEIFQRSSASVAK